MEETLEKSILKYFDFCTGQRAAKKYHEYLKGERSELNRKTG